MEALADRHLEVDDSTKGRQLVIGDLRIGDSVSQRYAFSEGARRAFSVLSNDSAPVHGSHEFAKARGFEEPIIQGLCVVSRFSRLIGMYLPGESAVLESLAFKFRKPVYQVSELQYRVEVVRVLAVVHVVRLKLLVANGGTVCVTGEAQCLVR